MLPPVEGPTIPKQLVTWTEMNRERHFQRWSKPHALSGAILINSRRVLIQCRFIQKERTRWTRRYLFTAARLLPAAVNGHGCGGMTTTQTRTVAATPRRLKAWMVLMLVAVSALLGGSYLGDREVCRRPFVWLDQPTPLAPALAETMSWLPKTRQLPTRISSPYSTCIPTSSNRGDTLGHCSEIGYPQDDPHGSFTV